MRLLRKSVKSSNGRIMTIYVNWIEADRKKLLLLLLLFQDPLKMRNFFTVTNGVHACHSLTID